MELAIALLVGIIVGWCVGMVPYLSHTCDPVSIEHYNDMKQLAQEQMSLNVAYFNNMQEQLNKSPIIPPEVEYPPLEATDMPIPEEDTAITGGEL